MKLKTSDNSRGRMPLQNYVFSILFLKGLTWDKIKKKYIIFHAKNQQKDKYMSF